MIKLSSTRERFRNIFRDPNRGFLIDADIKLKEAHQDHDTVILKGDSGDSIYVQNPNGFSTSKIVGRPAVVTLCTATSSEELRKISTIVAYSKPSAIILLCLLNRMGGYTTSFVNRISEFLSGILQGNSNKGVHFQFVPILDLPDYSSSDTRRALQRIDHEFRHFSENCLVTQFKHQMLAAEDRFQAVDLSSRAAFMPWRLNDATLQPQLLSAMHAAMVERQFEGLSAIPQLDCTAETICYVTSVWVIECGSHGPHYGATEYACRLKERLSQSRQDRLAKELKQEENVILAIEYAVAFEAKIIVCLALLQKLHMEKGVPGDDTDVEDLFFCHSNPVPWSEFPINCLLQYSNEEFAASIAFFVHLSESRFREENCCRLIKESITERSQALKRTISGIDCSSISTDYRALALTTIDLLLEEFGIIRRHNLSEIVVFLHEKLLSGSHPSQAIIDAYSDKLRYFISQSGRGPDFDDTIEKVKRSLHDLSHLAGRIEQFASYDKVAFRLEHAERYSASSQSSPLSKDLENLTILVDRQDIGPSESLCMQQMPLLDNIRNDFFAHSSPVLTALRSLVVPFEEHIVLALKDVSDVLTTKGFPKVWDKEMNRLCPEGVDPKLEHYVLIEPILLNEILWNIFTNVQHSLVGYKPPESGSVKSYENAVSLSIQRSVEAGAPQSFSAPLPRITLTVKASGLPFTKARIAPKPFATIDYQNMRLEDYNASLIYEDLADSSGSVARLTMLARDKSMLQSKSF